MNDAPGRESPPAAALQPETRRQLYRQMLRIRVVEETLATLYRDQEMRCPVHLCIGQEAVAVGVCGALRPEDQVVSAHRSHGHYLARGGDLQAMVAEIYGRANGCSGGKGGSMHLIDQSVGFLGSAPILAATIPAAVGAALGARMRGEQRVVVAFFGDAATEEGTFHESLNFAALQRLPVVFVCENNFFSVYSPLTVRQPAQRPIVDLARAQGLAGYQGDGNDVEGVFRIASEAVARVRAGEGPAFLELTTYRWREHCGPNFDDELGYRTAGELERWKERDPVQVYGQTLLAEGLLGEHDVAGVTRELEAEAHAACTHARNSPFPDPAELLTDVYAEGTR